MESNTRFIRKPEVRKLVGLSDTTIWRLEKTGDFPKRKVISKKSVAWSLAEVNEWMTSRQGSCTEVKAV